MKNYLFEMDDCMRAFLESTGTAPGTYIRGEFYYYMPLFFVEEGIRFNFEFFAVKIRKTTIVLVDKAHGRRIHFSDTDIRNILYFLKSSIPDFHKVLSMRLGHIISKTDLCDITFKLNEKDFVINGIPFLPEYSKILCKNPADIDLNGNDLIGLINLIIEKERTDKDKSKVESTCRYFLGS